MRGRRVGGRADYVREGGVEILPPFLFHPRTFFRSLFGFVVHNKSNTFVCIVMVRSCIRILVLTHIEM